MKKVRAFILGVFLLFLGCALLATFYFLASKNWNFFSDPGWKNSGDGLYRYRIEGGNMWYLLGLATPFVGGAVACSIKLWHLWKDYVVGRIFFGLVILIASLTGGYFWIIGFPAAFDNLKEWDHINNIISNILGSLGYIMIPSYILFILLSCGINLLKR